MNKLLKKISTAFVGMAMAVATGVAIGNNNKVKSVNADSDTLTFSTTTGSASNSVNTWTGTHLTIRQETGKSGSTAPNANYLAAPRWYSGNDITFIPNEGETITGLVIVSTSSSYAEALANSFNDVDADSATYSTSNPYKVTWTGSITSDYTIRMKAQSRLVSGSDVTITYSTSGGGEEPPATVDVTGVELDQESANLEVGDTLNLKATVSPNNATNKNVSWESSNETVATVSDGVVTALAEGNTNISVKTEDGEFTDTCAVTIKNINYGTLQSPLSVSEALELIETFNLGTNEFSKKQLFVEGVVTSNEEYTKFNNFDNTLTIADLDDDEVTLDSYRTKVDAGIELTEEQKEEGGIEGYTVIINGYIKNHNGNAIQFSGNSGVGPVIVSLEAPAPAQYTLSFLKGDEAASGSMENQVITEGEKLQEPKCTFTAPKGYEFDGWKIGNEKATFPMDITGDIELTASWKELVVPELLVVNYSEEELTVGDSLDSSKLSVTLLYSDDTEEIITSGYELFIRDGQEDTKIELTNTFDEANVYEIVVKYTPQGGEALEDTFDILVAEPEVEKVVVIFNYDNGEEALLKEIEKGSKVNKPADPTKENYDFLGWFVGEEEFDFTTLIESNITLTAHWKEVTPVTPVEKVSYSKVTTDLSDYSGRYLIVYESLAFDGSLLKLDVAKNTVEVSDNNGKIEVEKDENDFYFDVIKMNDGYAIKSAYGNYMGGKSGDNTIVESETALTNTIDINDDENADIISNTSVLHYNTQSGQEKFRYFKSASYTNQKAISLYRLDGQQPVQNPYTVKFNSGLGSGSMDDVEVFGPYKLPENGFTAPEGKEFEGWKIGNQGDLLEAGTTIEVSADIILTAQWKDKEVTPVDPVDPVEPTVHEVNVADALKVAKELEGGKSTTDKYKVTGIVVGEVEQSDRDNKDTYRFNIGDASTDTELLLVYWAKFETAPKTGDTVIIEGNLKNYVKNNQSTYEIENGVGTIKSGGGETPVDPVEPAVHEVNVAGALKVAKELEGGKSTTDKYKVTGVIVGEVEQSDRDNKDTYRFNIGDAATDTELLQVYWAKFEIAPKTGDTVIIEGNLKNFVKNNQSTYEIENGIGSIKSSGETPVDPVEPTVHEVNVADALKAAKALADRAESTDKYKVTGVIVGEVEQSDRDNKDTYRFKIGDASTDTELLLVYWAKFETAPKTGDTVIIEGNLKNFVSGQDHIYELTNGVGNIKSSGGTDPVDPGTDPVDPVDPGTDPVDPTPSGKTVTGIVVQGFSSNCLKGKELDLSNVKVFVVYSDNTQEQVSLENVKIEGFDSNKLGEQKVTVSYGEQKVTLTVYVTDAMGCHGSIIASSAIISITTLLGAGLLMFKKRKEN